MWVRRLSVVVRKPESEQDFDDKGLRRFSGEIRQILPSRPPRWCSLEVNPLKETLKATCDKNEVIFDQQVTVEDQFHAGAREPIGDLEVQQLTVRLKGLSEPVNLSVGTDVVTLLQKAFPKQAQ